MAVTGGSETYNYSALPSRTSIRLLRILSGVNEPIRISLEPVELDRQPRFDCLSYTWGDPLYHKLTPSYLVTLMSADRNIPIDCDGLVLFVTQNLHDVLLQLTKNGQRSTPADAYQYQARYRIWIDGLCINQRDLSERSSQVAMMNRIYRQAHTVVVWLGQDDMHTEAALRVMQNILAVPPQKQQTKITTELFESEVYETLEIDFVGPQEWLNYAAFLQRTYFTRVWVIQEVGMSNSLLFL